jgi:hypothetical protein
MPDTGAGADDRSGVDDGGFVDNDVRCHWGVPGASACGAFKIQDSKRLRRVQNSRLDELLAFVIASFKIGDKATFI